VNSDCEPITERLRGIPQVMWTKADIEEERAALRLRIERRQHKLETFRWLEDVFVPLQEKYTDTSMKGEMRDAYQ
jgi:hypothetical protein